MKKKPIDKWVIVVKKQNNLLPVGFRSQVHIGRSTNGEENEYFKDILSTWNDVDHFLELGVIEYEAKTSQI